MFSILTLFNFYPSPGGNDICRLWVRSRPRPLWGRTRMPVGCPWSPAPRSFPSSLPSPGGSSQSIPATVRRSRAALLLLTQNKGHVCWVFFSLKWWQECSNLVQVPKGDVVCCSVSPYVGKKRKLNSSESGWTFRTKTFHAAHKAERKSFPFFLQCVSKQGSPLALGTPQPTPLQNNPPAFSPALWGHPDPAQAMERVTAVE